nr:hydroxymethylbilane synthase [Candidatus Krumholzibacteria bacterium]
MSPSPEGLPIKPTLRIGTRGSDLALWQAHTIEDKLRDHGVATEIVIIKTRGDRIDNVPFSKLEGKGFFTKELEDAQLEGRVDLAVHSLKDLTTDQPDGLTLVAMVGREDPRELLLAAPDAIDQDKLKAGEVLPLKEGARIGTSAARRQAQVHVLRPDLKIVDLRGNVPTRINRLREGKYDAILLARAGVVRLELDVSDLFTTPLAITDFVPAPAQGMMGIQCVEKAEISTHLTPLHCQGDGQAVAAERLLLNRLDGGCQLPFGVNIRREDNQWVLEAFLAASPEDASPLRISLQGDSPDAVAEQAWEKITRHKNKDS